MFAPDHHLEGREGGRSKTSPQLHVPRRGAGGLPPPKKLILIENSQVDQERIGSFLRTAETLQIKGLADHPLKEQCQKTSSVSHQNPSFKNDPHPLPQTSLLAMPDQQDNAADYSPLLKRPRHSTGPNSSPLPCRQVFSSIRLFLDVFHPCHISLVQAIPH